MFLLIIAPKGGISPEEPVAMAAALRGGIRPVNHWRDANGRAAAAATVAGTLAEDAFCRQPFVCDDHVMVAQARIDNRDEVLDGLGVPPAGRAEIADGDVLFQAYRCWGENCTDRIAGDYAFAVWDRRSDRTAAFVSHYCAVRLFYAVAEGRLLLSPQLGALLANPRVSKELDIRALGSLVAPMIEAGTTPYRDIRAICGGQALRYGHGSLSLETWWNPDTAARVRYRDPRDYVRDAMDVLGQAVKCRLRAATPIATTMSGGLDSTLITALAADQLRASGATVDAYTAVPEPGLALRQRRGWDADDAPYAAAVAALHENVRHIKVAPGGLCPLDIVPTIHARSHTPVRNTANHVWMSRISSSVADSGRRIILSGDLGNFTFSASGAGAMRSLLWRLRWRAAGGCLMDRVKADGWNAWRWLARELVGQRGAASMRRLLQNGRTDERPGEFLLSKAFRAANGPSPPFPAFYGREALVKFPLLPRSATWMADPLAQWNVEYRFPLADRRLMERLLSFPLEAFVIGGRDRGLARAAGSGLVPDVVRHRRTSGAQAPEEAAMFARHAATYRAASDRIAQSPAYRAIVDIDCLERSLQGLCEGRGDWRSAMSVNRAMDVGLFIAGADGNA